MERMRDQREQTAGTDVMYGIHRMRFEGLAGRRLRDARAVLDAALDIQPDAKVLADGHPVGEDHIISADETLEFMAEAGKKG